MGVTPGKTILLLGRIQVREACYSVLRRYYYGRSRWHAGSMRKVSLTLPEERDDRLEERVEDGEHDSKSEAVRERLALAEELEERVEELEAELEHARARADEAEANAKHAREQAREQAEREEELLPLVREARDRTDRLSAREEARRQAPVWRRAKWALLGEPADLPERVEHDPE
jgi:Arc/MetJ-type ribon-helix-helix transcriptional regulator